MLRNRKVKKLSAKKINPVKSSSRDWELPGNRASPEISKGAPEMRPFAG